MGFLKAEVVGAPLAGMQERISPRGLGAVLRLGLQDWGAIIDEEFATASWRAPGGGVIPWAPVRAFGNVAANATPLQRSGRLRGAYRAAAAGGGALTVGQSEGSVEMRVNVPGGYAAVHRGGSGKLGVGNIAPLRIAVTTKMRWFLGLAKGVWLNRGTAFIEIPRRPHATTNPKIRGQFRYRMAQLATGKPQPARGAA